ncbi:MAG: GNAT family N-acetyltransferase, partial [Rickettsiaceae bacterium]|nr:GNAT family N-acetyltransferase [Rickettsiaceae bacterium]
MTITFKPLNESHFPLLLKWLESPHIKKWYDQDVRYTLELVHEKYSSYIKGYKLEGGVQRPIQGFIIHNNQNPVGYIQVYNAYDFPRSKPLSGLPESLGAIDIFIGEEEALGRGLGADSIKLFLETYGFPNYRYIFADPKCKNEIGVNTYEKAGFVIWKRVDREFWMVAHKKIVRLSIFDMIALETVFKQVFLPNDRLWVFGSRADLTKKGGDIDLYVETYAKTIDDAVEMKSKYIIRLEDIIGEQKIDLVLNMI